MHDFHVELATAAQAGTIERDFICEQIVDELIRHDLQPEWQIPPGDVNGIHVLVLDRYWKRKFDILPSVTTALDCAQWIRTHAAPEDTLALTERWAFMFGFLTRDSANSAAELSSANEKITELELGPIGAYFCLIYHGAKLRGNFRGVELLTFLEESDLAKSSRVYRERPIPLAMKAFAAFRAREDTVAEIAVKQVWAHPECTSSAVEMCLHGMIMAVNGKRHVPNLLAYAQESVERWPDAHLLHYRLAIALRLTGRFPEAVEAVDRALELLPTIGKRTSFMDFQERYLQERITIESLSQSERSA